MHQGDIVGTHQWIHRRQRRSGCRSRFATEEKVHASSSLGGTRQNRSQLQEHRSHQRHDLSARAKEDEQGADIQESHGKKNTKETVVISSWVEDRLVVVTRSSWGVSLETKTSPTIRITLKIGRLDREKKSISRSGPGIWSVWDHGGKAKERLIGEALCGATKLSSRAWPVMAGVGEEEREMALVVRSRERESLWSVGAARRDEVDLEIKMLNWDGLEIKMEKMDLEY